MTESEKAVAGLPHVFDAEMNEMFCFVLHGVC